MTDPLYRAIAHLTCREAYPKWDALLNKLAAGKTKAQKKAIMSEDISQKMENRRKALSVVKENSTDEDARLFPERERPKQPEIITLNH